MIERIDQPEDPRIADYRRVGDPEWLRAAGLFVAEGRLVVRRLLSQPRLTIRSILVTPPALEALSAGTPGSPPSGTGASPLARARVFVASQAMLNTVTGFNFHRGCLALAERPPESAVEEVVSGTRMLVLEGVSNPDNVGGLFRVAAAFGVSGVLLDPASGDPFYRKAVRTSMGSTLLVPQARLRPWPDALAFVRQQGFTLVALTPSSATTIQEVSDVDFRKIAVLVGAEGAGLSPGAIAAVDVTARIPMAGAIDSLNVTVAAGIALSHLG